MKRITSYGSTFYMAAFSVAAIIYIFISAELNYRQAMHEAILSDGSDAEISTAMQKHGFDADIFQDITTTDKVVALFNVKP